MRVKHRFDGRTGTVIADSLVTVMGDLTWEVVWDYSSRPSAVTDDDLIVVNPN